MVAGSDVMAVAGLAMFVSGVAAVLPALWRLRLLSCALARLPFSHSAPRP